MERVMWFGYGLNHRDIPIEDYSLEKGNGGIL